MPFSGGIFQRLYNWVTDKNSAIKILASRMDGEFDNYASGINDIVNGTQPFTGTVKAPYGTVSAPGFQFNGDGDTGLVRTGADTVALATGGAARLTANTTALTSTLPLSLPVGSAATPAANWNSNDGFFSPSAGVMALSLGGVERLRWTTTGQSGAIAPISGANQFKVINGDFSVNQRAFTSVSLVPTIQQYTVDAWRCFAVNDTTVGLSCEWLANTGAVGGFIPARVLRIVSTGQFTSGSRQSIQQRIESARTYSGQTVTFFGWMKRATAGNIAFSIRQHFGTGGSPSADVTTYVGQAALTTSFAPYRFVANIPSVAGKTFGTNNDDYLEITFWASAGSNFNAETGSLGLFNTTVDFWAIHDRPGDLSIDAINSYQTSDQQAELARCQRLFEVMDSPMKVSSSLQVGQATFAVPKRATPTLSNITFGTGTGATFSATKTSVVQTALHSANATVTGLWASAEL